MSQLLLVDDQNSVLALKLLLQRQGHKVTTARSADEAKEIIQQRTKAFDLILTDYDMPPGDNGYDLCVELKSLGSTVPSILMTGRNRSVEQLDLAQGNILTITHKPLDMQMLNEQIREATSMTTSVSRTR